MDTFTDPQPTTPAPAPARDGREAPSRLRVLATSVAVAALTATGGLAVVLSTAAIGSSAIVAPAAPGTTAAPTATQSTTNAAQPPRSGQGNGPAHASSGGS